MINQLELTGQKLIGLIDRLNDKLTSYRLMLYYLLALLIWALVGSFSGQIGYSWHELLVSASWLLVVCWAVNKLISRFLDIPANKESDLISALILALILAPPTTIHNFAILAAAGAVAMASKYVITFHKTHLFNPAAAGAFVAGEIFHNYPVWWVGTKFMTPVVLIGGILVIRKMKRFSMLAAFFGVFIAYQLFGAGGTNLHLLWLELISTQLLFFGCVMLIEPQTSPTTIKKYLPYAVLVGLLYSITSLKLSPEAALLVGNLFTLAVAANHRYKLKYLGRVHEAEGIYSYVFAKPKGLAFRAGQYMEWAIAHNKTDARGNRRYLTISASPTEDRLMFTVKHPAKASSFKQKLDELKPSDSILASHLSGDFNLSKDPAVKVTLLAGGVGITPFRSMIKNLLDNQEQRDVALMYSVSSPAEVAFGDLFKRAEQVGLKTSYVTEGYIDQAKISAFLPDYKDRTYYVSGPYGFVQAMHQTLIKMNVPLRQVITDYFPGYGG